MSGKSLTLSGVLVLVSVLISLTSVRSPALLMDILMNAELFRELWFQQEAKGFIKSPHESCTNWISC